MLVMDVFSKKKEVINNNLKRTKLNQVLIVQKLLIEIEKSKFYNLKTTKKKESILNPL